MKYHYLVSYPELLHTHSASSLRRSTWRIEPASTLSTHIRSFLPMRASIEGCRSATKWPTNLVLPSTSAHPLDVSSWPVDTPVVSDRFRALTERLAPGQIQFLPVCLSHRGNLLANEPVFWIANRLLSFDCGKQRASEENWRIDERRIPLNVHVFGIRGWAQNFIVSDAFLRACRDEGVSGLHVKSLGTTALPRKSRPVLRISRAPRFPHTERRGSRDATSARPHSMTALVRSLTASGLAEVNGGGSDVDIETVERRLGVTLPRAIREWLRVAGGGIVGGEDVYGLDSPRKNVCDSSIRQATERQRRQVPRWPTNLIVVGDDGSGNCFCADAGSRADPSAPVFEWDHELAATNRNSPPIVHRRHRSFLLWLRRLAFNK